MSDPKIEINWIDGLCPVQSEGRIDGERYYFRARGNRVSLEIGKWTYAEMYGDEPFAAGYISEEEARDFIRNAAVVYRGRHEV